MRTRKIISILLIAILFQNAGALQAQRYKVGVIDLMLLKRQKLGAIPLAREVGADGLEVDMGGLGNRPTFENQLLNDSIREAFLKRQRSSILNFFHWE